MHVTPINKNKVFKHQEYCYSISCYIAIWHITSNNMSNIICKLQCLHLSSPYYCNCVVQLWNHGRFNWNHSKFHRLFQDTAFLNYVVWLQKISSTSIPSFDKYSKEICNHPATHLHIYNFSNSKCIVMNYRRIFDSKQLTMQSIM